MCVYAGFFFIFLMKQIKKNYQFFSGQKKRNSDEFFSGFNFENFSVDNREKNPVVAVDYDDDDKYHEVNE